IADLPPPCRGHFHRNGQVKLEYRASRGGKRWRPLRAGWEEIDWEQRFLPPTGVTYQGEGDDPSPFTAFRASQGDISLGLGCALKARARVKLAIVDEASGAIVAIRLLDLPIAVDGWFRARCQGKFSIHDVGAARRCPRRAIGAVPGGKPLVWGVKAERIGCGAASAVAQRALQAPAYAQGAPTSQEVEGWRCHYANRPAVACLRGSRRVYMIARGGVGESCGGVRGARGFSVVGAPCEVAAELVGAVPRNPPGQPFGHEAGGRTWFCAAYIHLEPEDRQQATYHCFSGGALVTFVVKGKDRVVPVEPESIPAEAILPAEGPASLFTLTPELRFGDGWKWTSRKLFAQVEAEPALAGQPAGVEVIAYRAKCEWTSDPGEDVPICPSRRRVGRTLRRISLTEDQLIFFAPRQVRGNWIYRMRITTKPFSLGRLRYGRTSHVTWAYMINDAAHCERNPWCYRNNREAR
ncbi:MAG TPA: hypothetical protein VNR67_04080, partial [Solirubrobacterales bacterium]|nr:hypothetical protein [Solirubrobacterales bacterium]